MNWDTAADLTYGQKFELVKDYFDRYPRSYVFETGIWNGMGSTFQFAERARVTAIETNLDSCELAQRNHPLVRVVHGDSATELPELLSFTPDSAFFWLDAHLVAESGEENHSPLIEELEAILAWEHAADSVILIDDVRMMGREGWPTLDQVWNFNRLRIEDGPVWNWDVAADIVRLTPREHV